MQLKSPKLLYKDDRPREKLEKFGAGKLTTTELLQVLIGSGNKTRNVSQIASDMAKQINAKVTINDLRKVGGIGLAKASIIQAGIELGLRLASEGKNAYQSPEDFLPHFQQYKSSKREHLISFSLDGASRLIEKRVVSIGTLSSALIHPREVFADAIADRAMAIVIAHNHPSGIISPSSEDDYVTNLLKEAGQILGITLLDHIIFNKDEEVYSYKRAGRL